VAGIDVAELKKPTVFRALAGIAIAFQAAASVFDAVLLSLGPLVDF
jgi:hypothetical protein